MDSTAEDDVLLFFRVLFFVSLISVEIFFALVGIVRELEHSFNCASVDVKLDALT